MSIQDKVVLITGATGSLGRPLADAFGAAGARLALVVSRLEAVHPTEQEWLARGLSAFVISCDVRYEEDVVRMVHRVIRRFGRIDVVVNAAAMVGPRELIEDYPVEPWRNVMATNVTGSYLVCREVLPWMRRQGSGRILNLTSSLSKSPRSTWGAYLVSNHAIEGLSRLLAAELKGSGVRVNAVDVGLPQVETKSAAGADWVEAILLLAGETPVPSGQLIVAAQFTKPAASV